MAAVRVAVAGDDEAGLGAGSVNPFGGPQGPVPAGIVSKDAAEFFVALLMNSA